MYALAEAAKSVKKFLERRNRQSNCVRHIAQGSQAKDRYLLFIFCCFLLGLASLSTQFHSEFKSSLSERLKNIFNKPRLKSSNILQSEYQKLLLKFHFAVNILHGSILSLVLFVLHVLLSVVCDYLSATDLFLLNCSTVASKQFSGHFSRLTETLASTTASMWEDSKSLCICSFLFGVFFSLSSNFSDRQQSTDNLHC